TSAPWRRALPRDSDDGKIIVRLDRQYQCAVQQNDAATRILADDFVLVTGSGKTHTRAVGKPLAKTVRICSNSCAMRRASLSLLSLSTRKCGLRTSTQALSPADARATH